MTTSWPTMKSFLKRGIGSFRLLHDSASGPAKRSGDRLVVNKRMMRTLKKIERTAQAHAQKRLS